MDFAKLQEPLSPDEWALLEEVLDESGPYETDGVLGMLTAVVTAPSMIPPSRWLPLALGRYVPTDDEVPALLLRLYNEIISALEQGEVLCPEPDEVDDIQRFCKGYLAGVALDDVWTSGNDAVGFIRVLSILAHPPDEDAADDAIAEDIETLRQTLPRLAVTIYEELAPKRASAASSTARRGPKIGRNDPCPCGSGKKYKKCCLP